MFTVFAWSSKVAKPSTPFIVKLISRSWKGIRNKDVDISSSTPAVFDPVEDFNSFNIDLLAVVNGDPGGILPLGMAEPRKFIAICFTIYAVAGYIDRLSGRQGGCHGAQLSNTYDELNISKASRKKTDILQSS